MQKCRILKQYNHCIWNSFDCLYSSEKRHSAEYKFPYKAAL